MDALSERVKKMECSAPSTSITSEQALERVQFLLRQVTKMKGKVYVIGNGGSAGIASHFSIDLLKTLEIPATTLTDSNLLTCLGNDFGYEHVFSYPLQKMMQPHDLLFAVSSSGRSQNIINAATVAQEKNATVITLSGFLTDNPLRKLGEINFWIESEDYGIVETSHFFILHTIIDSLNLCLKKSNQFQKSAP